MENFHTSEINGEDRIEDVGDSFISLQILYFFQLKIEKKKFRVGGE